MPQKLVSIVIASWNRREDLRETLNAYLQQSYLNLEIIVVDNGSTDGTAEMVQREFPKVAYVGLAENTGVAAYNIGMKMAKGEIIVVSDNDSYLEPGGIEKILHKFEQGERNLAVVACEIVFIPSGSIYQWYYHPADRKNPDKLGYPTHMFIGAGAAIKNSVLKEVGYYPEEFFLFMNEIDLSTRIIGAGYEIRYFPDIIAYHKGSMVSRPKRDSQLMSFRNIIWYYWKYYPISVAFRRSMLRIPFDILVLSMAGISPVLIWKTLSQTARQMPAIMRNRTPIPRQYVKKALGYRGELSNLYSYCREVLTRKLASRRKK
jgi:hypothetical protein